MKEAAPVEHLQGLLHTVGVEAGVMQRGVLASLQALEMHVSIKQTLLMRLLPRSQLYRNRNAHLAIKFQKLEPGWQVVLQPAKHDNPPRACAETGMTARTGRSAPATRPQSSAAPKLQWPLACQAVLEASCPLVSQWSPTINRALAALHALRESEAPHRRPFAAHSRQPEGPRLPVGRESARVHATSPDRRGWHGAMRCRPCTCAAAASTVARPEIWRATARPGA
eukprot:scaffold3853_cov60-Phaeocystis_antarctica.AAC.4